MQLRFILYLKDIKFNLFLSIKINTEVYVVAEDNLFLSIKINTEVYVVAEDNFIRCIRSQLRVPKQQS